MTLSDVQIQNLLAEHAEAVIAGKADLEALLAAHGIPADSRIAQLLFLAERLYVAMPEVRPSPEFVQSLYVELVGSGNITLLDRLRQIQTELQAMGLSLPSLQQLQAMGLGLPNLQQLQTRLPHLQDLQEFLANRQLQRANLQLERSIDRFRHMPRHYQLAAGLTLTAGVFWLAARMRREGLYSLLVALQQYQSPTATELPGVEISA